LKNAIKTQQRTIEMKEATQEAYLKWWYEDMLLWRKFEDKLAALYIQQKVRLYIHIMDKKGISRCVTQWT
jgi:pyruvate dehydrogenase E1 component alpha subunit